MSKFGMTLYEKMMTEATIKRIKDKKLKDMVEQGFVPIIVECWKCGTELRGDGSCPNGSCPVDKK